MCSNYLTVNSSSYIPSSYCKRVEVLTAYLRNGRPQRLPRPRSGLSAQGHRQRDRDGIAGGVLGGEGLHFRTKPYSSQIPPDSSISYLRHINSYVYVQHGEINPLGGKHRNGSNGGRRWSAHLFLLLLDGVKGRREGEGWEGTGATT